VPFDLDAGQGRWRIDLSVWLGDLHGHVADWQTRLRDTITDQQRLAVLRIKDMSQAQGNRAGNPNGLVTLAGMCALIQGGPFSVVRSRRRPRRFKLLRRHGCHGEEAVWTGKRLGL
jgi:hypothetical protein